MSNKIKKNLNNQRESSTSKERITGDKLNCNENISITSKRDSKASSSIEPILIFSNKKKRKYITNYIYKYTFFINFLLIEFILCFLPKKVLSTVFTITLKIDEIGDQQIFSDLYDLDQFYPYRIFVNDQVQILRNKRVIVDKPYTSVKIDFIGPYSNMSYMFANLNNIYSASVRNMLNDSYTNFSYMFYNCKKLLNFSYYSDYAYRNPFPETTKMFYNCISLLNFTFKNYYTPSNQNMSYMFYNCNNLDLVYFANKISTNDIRFMFYNCYSLNSMNFSLFTLTDANVSYLFYNCSRLNMILPFQTVTMNDMNHMFYNCKSLENIDLSGFTFSDSNMSYLFYNCLKLNNISWCDEIKPTDMRYMFFNCYNIPEINIPIYNGNTNYYINMTRMFYNCNKANTIIFKESTKTYFPNDIHAMFYNCTSLLGLDLENIIKSDYIYDMSYSFYNCSNMSDLRINFENSLTTNMRGIFQNCHSLTSLNLSQFSTKYVEIMWDMFKGCDNLETLDLSKFDTSKVTDMESMFEGCSSLISLSLDNFITHKVQYMNKMFRGCSSLTSLSLKNSITKSVGTMHQMFYNCSSLEYLNIYSMVEKGQSIAEMFEDASNNFTFCVKENENIPNIFQVLLNMDYTVRDCSDQCYDNERVNISEKKLCCPFVRYKDNCYNKCPSKTHVEYEDNICLDFTCNYTYGEYYNYEQSDCTNNIKGFYVNDSLWRTIDKCHEDCEECEEKWTSESSKCTKCKASKPFIYRGNCFEECPKFYDSAKTICKCFEEKCGKCTEESLKYDLCVNCNIEDGYHHKENDTTNRDSWINCYKDPENYYLFGNDIYKRCYKSCKYCLSEGTEQEHKCKSCNNENSFGIPYVDRSSNKLYNCYKNCTYYYYFDNQKKYHCTKTPHCPEEFSKLIYGERQCIKSCNETDDKKYEFRGVCYKECPPDISYTDDINNYFCKITCPFEEPFEMVKKQICVSNCTIMERVNKLCRTNYRGNRTIEEVQDKVLTNLQNDIIDTFNYKILNESYSVILYEADSIYTYEILSTNINKDYKDHENISKINLDECAKTLKDYYNIKATEPLYLLKLDAKKAEMKNAKVEYLVYYPLNGERLEALDLALCEGLGIILYFQANLSDPNIDLYNINSGYYNDICYTYTSDDGIDIPIEIRRSLYSDNNQSLCEEGCNVANIHSDTGEIECKCNAKYSLPFVSEISIDKDMLYKFVDIKNLINFKVMKCYHLLFQKDTLFNNIGFYIYFPTFIVYFICVILFFKKQYDLIKQSIKEIVDSKKRLKYMIDNGSFVEEIIQPKFEDPALYKILKLKGMKLPSKLRYVTDKIQPKVNIQNKIQINININNDKIKPIKEEVEKENDLITHKISNRNIKNISKIKNKKFTPKTKDIYNDKNSNNAPPIKSHINFKEKVIKTSSKNIKYDISMIDEIKNNDVTEEEKEEIKRILKYNDTELNNMSYRDALKYDKRSFFEFYFALIKNKHQLITLFETRDYNSRIIKIFLFFFSFASCYAINGLFFDDDTMHAIYYNKGEYSFIDQLPQIVYSTIISYIFENLLNFLSLSEDDVIAIKQEKIIAQIDRKKNEVLKTLHIKFNIFFILSLFLLLLFWYYISCFCAVYKNTQYHLLTDTLISFGTSMCTPFPIYLAPPIFRIPSLKKKSKMNEILYGFSKILQFF